MIINVYKKKMKITISIFQLLVYAINFFLSLFKPKNHLKQNINNTSIYISIICIKSQKPFQAN